VQPELKMTALDLSAPYLARAKKALKGAKNASFVEAAAEDMPLPDASVDIAVSIYLFHELPPKVRAAAAKEIARVLKPGGIFVFADSIQYDDASAFEGLLDVFPELLHEPYYSTYAKTDLAKLFGAAGLKHISNDVAYLTKISVFEKQKPARRKRG
jgi:ubiquinone/menaquinone biosynthesis C-methylase UbiE